MTTKPLVVMTCDRCGESEQHNAGSESEMRWGKLLALQPSGPDWIGAQARWEAHNAKDLCPTCMADLRKWMKT